MFTESHTRTEGLPISLSLITYLARFLILEPHESFTVFPYVGTWVGGGGGLVGEGEGGEEDF